MKARYFVIILIMVFVAVALIAAIVLSKRGQQDAGHNASYKNAVLLINGNAVNSDYAKLYETHAEVPLVEVLQSVGCSVSWKNQHKATIAYGDKTFTLTLSKKPSLLAPDVGELLLIAPGSEYFYCYSVKQDVVVDTGTLRHIFNSFGIKAKIQTETDSIEIYIPA